MGTLEVELGLVRQIEEGGQSLHCADAKDTEYSQ